MNNIYVDKIITDCAEDLDLADTILLGLGPTSNISPYLNKYSIIRACGCIEICFKTIISDFCNKRSKKQLKQFINGKIRDSSINPRYDNICKTLRVFDEEWYKNFKDKINCHTDRTMILTSLESLNDARNEFAHGGNPTTTLKDTKNYFKQATKIIEILDNIVN